MQFIQLINSQLFGRRLFIALVLGVTSITSIYAQTFTPIVGDYQCAEFSDQSRFLVKITDTGFILVKSSEVQKKFNSERRIIKQRLKVINELLAAFKKSRVSKSKLIKGANKTLLKLFGGETIPQELSPSDAELAVENLKQRLLDRAAILGTISDLLRNCASGINSKKNRGTPIGVSIKPVSIASSREIYGGFVIYASKMKNKFSKVPTGYNVCIKLIFPDGFIGKFYTGFGDDNRCGTGTLIFEGVPPNLCNALIPEGQVGYVIQKREYAFTSLPDATTEELLDRMRLEVIPDEPVVGVMAFPVDMSRDASVKACEAFLGVIYCSDILR